MIKIIPAEARYYLASDWLKSYYLFSFSSYNDPENVQFGNLRVFNDFTIEPGKGFSMHTHSEAEIVTIVLEGELTHEDNLGNKKILGKEDVQCMTTGSGVEHSEFNRGKEPLHLYQIWILPVKSGLMPEYSQKKFQASMWENKLLPLVSGKPSEGTLKMNGDATIYRSNLKEREVVHFNLEENRLAFIYISSGELFVNGNRLKPGDQARIDQEKTLHLEASSTESVEFILIETAP
ncbi:MAG: pirin family protein [Methanosarcina sp.]